MNRSLLPAFVLWAASAGALAAELGMDAPPLKLSKYIKGGPVDLAAGRGTNVFVVEFWATWCGPCRESIPHLTELQKKFKDRKVVIIGVSDESVEKVKPFVNKFSEKMDYVVAIDDGQKTAGAYMRAFGIDGIPHAFVVNKEGRIAWQGHPMAGLDQALEDILEGRHDIEAANRALAAAQSMREYFEKAVNNTGTASSRELGERVIKDGGGSPALLNEFAWIILTHPRIKDRDVELATRAARIAFDKTDGNDPSIVNTYARAFFEAGKFKEAIEMQKKAVSVASDPVEREQLEKTLHLYEAKLN